MRPLLAVVANLVFIFGFVLTSYAQETIPLEVPTEIPAEAPLEVQVEVPATSVVPAQSVTDTLIAAYEAGNYRVIETSGTWLEASPDGAYISAYDAGVYRVSDGMVLGQYDRAVFSPNGAYFAQDGDGVYRLPDLQRIIAIDPMAVPFTTDENSDDPQTENRERITGRVTFSSDSQYAAISGAGVYRLSDAVRVVDTSQQPLVDLRAFNIEFSPDNTMAATGFGIYRLSDGQRLGTSLGQVPHFSPDNAYVWLDYVYRLSDGVRLFEVLSPLGVDFSPNMQYAVVLGDGVYQLSDGARIYSLPPAPESSDTLFSSDSQYMVTPDGVYVVATGERILTAAEGSFMDALFTPDGSHIAVGGDGMYRLSDRVRLFDIGGSVERFDVDGTYLVSDGVYRTTDGQRIIEASGTAVFSADRQYVAISNAGLYRLSDGQMMFPIGGTVESFTDDGTYINVSNDFAVYRVLDGESFPGLRFLNIPAGILAQGNSVLVAQPAQVG